MVPRRRGPRAPHPGLHPLERRGDGGQGQQARRRHRRPPGHLRLARPRSTRSGFNHFFRGKDDGLAGDHVYFQGHAAPGIYARAFLEGRLDEDQLDHFRREIGGGGLSRYPHPRLMPDFWEYPTVSMGLGPINSIYQARFNRYLHNRQHRRHRRVAGCGASSATARPTSPRRSASISLAGREGLDNLTWVVNCNLQRLDGPVRGNGKIIQELEAVFRGAGWNVIKVVWGSASGTSCWPSDVDGVLLDKMNTTVDGEFQRYAVEDGAYIREHFFGPDPRLRKLVEHLSDEELRNLPRGGHDYRKLYAAYKAATEQRGRAHRDPGQDDQGLDARPRRRGPQRHPPDQEDDHRRSSALLRERLHLHDEIPEEALADGAEPPYYRPPERLAEHAVPAWSAARPSTARCPSRVVRTKRPLDAARRRGLRRAARPARASRRRPPPRPSPGCCATCAATRASARGSCRSSPTRPARSAWTRCSRSSGSTPSQGQKYEPVDHDLLLSYTESPDGQILEEGITEAGALASFIAAGTAYATRGVPMVPFFIFYSMFGFQRVGDLIWPAADARARGFLLGATAGRTTLLGEGLQHQDGHSLAAGLDRARPAGLRPGLRLRGGRPSCATASQPHVRPRARGRLLLPDPLQREPRRCRPWPDGVADGVIEGLYRWADGARGRDAPGHDPVLRLGPRARPAPPRPSWPSTTAWAPSCGAPPSTSACARRRSPPSAGTASTPTEPARTPRVTELLGRAPGPVVAVTDFMKAVPDQIARWVPAGRRSRRSAPTASAAATPARRCAASSRSTPPTWWSPCWPPWPPPARSRPRSSPRPSPATASTPTPSTPAARSPPRRSGGVESG